MKIKEFCKTEDETAEKILHTNEQRYKCIIIANHITMNVEQYKHCCLYKEYKRILLT